MQLVVMRIGMLSVPMGHCLMLTEVGMVGMHAYAVLVVRLRMWAVTFVRTPYAIAKVACGFAGIMLATRTRMQARISAIMLRVIEKDELCKPLALYCAGLCRRMSSGLRLHPQELVACALHPCARAQQYRALMAQVVEWMRDHRRSRIAITAARFAPAKF